MTFESQVRAVIAPNTAKSVAAYSGPDILAALSYNEELRIKRLAWSRFAKELRVGDAKIEDVAACEQPRGYRATSRRRVLMHRGSASLAHGDGSVLDAEQAALLEPTSHAQIYEVVQRLVRPSKPPLNINNVIIRGSYDEHVIIFDVREIDADVVRTLKKWTKTISTHVPSLKHAWIFHDPSGTNFFLEQERLPRDAVTKKLLGAAAWIQKVNALDYQIGVFSFTQINLAMTPSLIETVKRVRGDAGGTLYDLFCGYGLYGAAFAKEYERVVAIDADEATVANARYNIKRAGGTVTAITAMMTAKTIDRLVASEAGHPTEKRTIILDPPRGDMPTGLRSRIAELAPQRIVELFIEPDEINRNVREWSAAGYACDTVVPVDLFPGTSGIEVVLGFSPARQRRSTPPQTRNIQMQTRPKPESSTRSKSQPATRSRAQPKTSR